MGGRGASSGVSGAKISERIDAMRSYSGYGDEKVNLLPMASENDILESNRLYHEKGLNSIAAGAYKNREVSISNLQTRQDWVDSDKLKDMAEVFRGKISGLKSEYDQGVRALEYKGKLIVIDGNHRVNLAILKGQKRMKIRVCKVD